jgi:hypothetical protein
VHNCLLKISKRNFFNFIKRSNGVSSLQDKLINLLEKTINRDLLSLDRTQKDLKIIDKIQQEHLELLDKMQQENLELLNKLLKERRELLDEKCLEVLDKTQGKGDLELLDDNNSMQKERIKLKENKLKLSKEKFEIINKLKKHEYEMEWITYLLIQIRGSYNVDGAFRHIHAEVIIVIMYFIY